MTAPTRWSTLSQGGQGRVSVRVKGEHILGSRFTGKIVEHGPVPRLEELMFRRKWGGFLEHHRGSRWDVLLECSSSFGDGNPMSLQVWECLLLVRWSYVKEGRILYKCLYERMNTADLWKRFLSLLCRGLLLTWSK